MIHWNVYLRFTPCPALLVYIKLQYVAAHVHVHLCLLIVTETNFFHGTQNCHLAVILTSFSSTSENDVPDPARAGGVGREPCWEHSCFATIFRYVTAL